MKITDYSKDSLELIAKNSNSFNDMLDSMGHGKSGGAYKVIRNVVKRLDIDISHFKLEQNRLRIYDNSVDVGINNLKLYILEAGIRTHRCENCNLDIWLGDKIPLELHHIDGNRNNNTLDNLKLLCPNCHSLTENYRGRKNKVLQDTVCISCGIKICKGATTCRKCLGKLRENPNKPKKEVLVEEAKHNTITSLAEKYKTSRASIRRWIIN